VPAALVVMAKEPVPGRTKTRLCPPLRHAQAAALAQAALADTLAAVADAQTAGRRVLVLEGRPGDWLAPGFELIAQRGGCLAERLSNAVVDVGEALLLLGMDTPQLTGALLDQALERLGGDGVDAVLGPSDDGGYWTIGLDTPDPRVFEGVPMSAATTGAAQRTRLVALGLRVADLCALRDVDSYEDVAAVAALAPRSCFAAAAARLRLP